MGTAATAGASSSYPCVVSRDAAINHNNANRHSVPLRCSCLFPLPNIVLGPGITAQLHPMELWRIFYVGCNEASQCSVHCAVSRLNRATPGRGQLKDSIAASFALILTISSLPIHTFKRRKLSNGTWNACSDFCRFGSSLRYGRPQLYKILAAVFEGMLRVSLGPARPGPALALELPQLAASSNLARSAMSDHRFDAE